MAGEPRPFQELAALDSLRELLNGQKEVIPAVLLASAGFPCRGRYGADEFGEARQDLADEGALARAGRTGDDDDPGDDRS